MDREIIKVPGVNNFRGLGGIKVGDKHFNNGLVYRSAGLHMIKKKGIETLKNLKITTVLDLRNENEQAQNKDPEIPFLKTLGFDFTGGALPGITREQLGEMSPSQFIKKAPRMEELYAFILDKDHIGEVGRALNALIATLLNGEAVLYHCSAGKDRTGILTMLLLKLLGASEEEIFKDYLLTNDWAIPSAKRLMFLAKFKDKEMAKAIYPLYIADASYLHSAIDTVINNYGSFDNLFDNVFKIEKETVSRLKELCLS